MPEGNGYCNNYTVINSNIKNIIQSIFKIRNKYIISDLLNSDLGSKKDSC